MTLRSINPANGRTLATFDLWDDGTIESALTQAHAASTSWASLWIEERCAHLRRVAEQLRKDKHHLASLITEEMGKLIKESEAEIDKCAWVCDYYAQHASRFLRDEPIDTDAEKSLVAYQPLGTVLAIMPWNFPFWQVFRCAVPALAAGNTVVLKHASNVPQCALAIEQIFQDNLPNGAFRTLLISSSQIPAVIGDPRIQAVSLTGSEAAGRKVAEQAGHYLKKCVLELGGSDPFIVLENADLAAASETAVTSRFLNNGQSCIAAKRFIVVDAIADAFVERFQTEMNKLKPGDPKEPNTTLAPMARPDLRDTLDQQVHASHQLGAEIISGGTIAEGPGFFYTPTLLDQVKPDMPAFDEEVFGPVAAIIRVQNEEEALYMANQSPFGLGGSVWTQDAIRGERLARRLGCGSAFVNGLVKSDPRLPFGGVKNSGFGRELSLLGIREFVNAKTLWVR